MHGKKTKAGERLVGKKGFKCRRKEQFKVGISQDRESRLGEAYGQCVGGAC